jgi:aspartate/methionine/tyrosine aminotransferase
LLLAAALLVDVGQTLLMGDPGYPCNRHFVRLVEGRAQLVATTAAQRYQLTAELAEPHWQPNTAGILVASPANPTGEILDRDQLAQLWLLCQRRNGHLLVDEIYHGLTYECRAPSIVEITDRAFALNSFSKYFGMTGWRLGWLVAPANAVTELEKLAQNLFIAPSTPAQYAALAAFTPAARVIFDARRDELQRRRDYLLAELRALGFGIAHVPAGAFYLYADASRFTDDSERFCFDLLEQHGVALTPGADFGTHNANTFVRFAYTTGMARLEEAVRRLRTVCR